MNLQGEETVESEEQPVHVLLVEDEPDLRSTLRYNLKRAGYAVTDAGNGQEALVALAAEGSTAGSSAVEIVISDVMMPVMDGHALARAVRANAATAELPFMFLTAKGDTADRVEGFRLGADDYLTKPFDIEELLARVQVLARRAYTARRMRRLLPALEPGAPRSGLAKQAGDLYAKVAEWERRFPALAVIRNDSIVGASMRTMLLLREVLVRAPGKDPVLIIGETGTGKTGVAEALHRLGPRADKAFRVVNCAELGAADHAITAGKLFGFGKGSGLTNVSKDGQPGLLEDVDGGTLFFDEIHRLPLDAQAMLLLPIEGRPFHPAVGKGDPRTVDVKFIFATNVDLRAEAQAGRFPFDLYQRLAQSQIRVPALAERREDIAVLASHFLDECKAEYELHNATFAPSLLRHLVERSYEGNIRELRHLVREIARRAAFELDTVLTLEHLPEAWDKLPEGGAPAPVVLGIPAGAGADSASADSASADSASADNAAGRSAPPGTDDDGGGFWHELEMAELRALRRHRFKIAAAEQELGLSSKSRTLTNHLRGMCFKALCQGEKDGRFDCRAAALLVVGRSDDALLDRTVERLESYLDMVEKHVAAHSVETLFNNLPRDYRKHVERAIDVAREKLAR
ncbi:MAG: sigma-54-dependent Fis family transcriptional regulator [Deltaproteobacteria bacterium]|nr:sigma-54-dependent Fis family transcriptional regulator [Deltaproteobacteria bacterium]